MSMKKSAVAVALLAAMGAQAQVTLYGTLDLNLSSSKPQLTAGTESSRVTEVANGGLTASFIGLAGEEDLGAGLKASFQLESLVNVDTGAANGAGFWSRNANVAISSEFGKLTVGRKQKIYYDSVAAFSPFGSASLGTSMTVLNNLAPHLTDADVVTAVSGVDGTFTSSTLAAESRAWDNSLTYESPEFNGFTAAVQVGLKEAATTGNNVAVTAQYTAGPLALGIAYQATKLGAAATLDEEDTRFTLGASYDLGVAKLFGQFGKIKWTDAITGDTDLKMDAFQLGATVPLTEEGTVMVSAGQAKQKDVAVDPSKRTVFSLGYDHNLSKRTDVYGVVKSDKLTGYTTGNTVAVGVRHRF